MTRVYISGPMTGMPQLNFPAFHSAAKKLRAKGYKVINPAELDGAEEQTMEWHQYLRRDIVELVKCEVIAMLPGWVNSRGAKLEKSIADALGMKTIYLGPDAGNHWGLTPRQVEVIQALALHKGQKAAARSLGISYHTLEAHVFNAGRKMDVQGRGAVLKAWLAAQEAAA
jgi:DNA-binding CsgD family transcriptional regulator